MDKFSKYVYLLCTLYLYFFVAVVIAGIDPNEFDDYHNYQTIYERIKEYGFKNISAAYREIGLLYVYLPFSIFDVSYEYVIKIIILLFSVVTILLASISRSGKFNILGGLITFSFVVSNRQYIEGAFNYTRSWVAMHFFVWFLACFYKSKKNLNWCIGGLLLLSSFLIHLQTTIVLFSLVLMCVILDSAVSRTKVKVILMFVFYMLIVYLFDQDIFQDYLRSINGNVKTESRYIFSIGLMYQVFVPIVCFVITAFIVNKAVSFNESCGSSFSVSVNLLLFISMLSFVAPVALRFTCFFLLFLSVMFSEIYFNFIKSTFSRYKLKLQLKIFLPLAVLNVVALYFSSL